MPALRNTSATGMPTSTSFSTATICGSVNRGFRMPLPIWRHRKSPLQRQTARGTYPSAPVHAPLRDTKNPPDDRWAFDLEGSWAAHPARRGRVARADRRKEGPKLRPRSQTQDSHGKDSVTEVKKSERLGRVRKVYLIDGDAMLY